VGSGSTDNGTQYVRSTNDRVTHPDRDDGPTRMRIRRFSYVAGMILFTGIVATGVTDSFHWTEVTGVSADTASATRGGYHLEVRYPAVTRPAIASPVDIRVERDGGFDGPIQIAVSWPWLEMWDENAWYPSPSTSYGDDEELVMEFDPPPGEELRVIYDARIQPAQQSGRDGSVSVLEDDVPVVTVQLRTRVMP
jgi:hypothetical protein